MQDKHSIRIIRIIIFFSSNMNTFSDMLLPWSSILIVNLQNMKEKCKPVQHNRLVGSRIKFSVDNGHVTRSYQRCFKKGRGWFLERKCVNCYQVLEKFKVFLTWSTIKLMTNFMAMHSSMARFVCDEYGKHYYSMSNSGLYLPSYQSISSSYNPCGDSDNRWTSCLGA